MAFFSDRIEDVRRALRKLRKGEKPTPQTTDDLAWIKRTLGLKRPLTEYSERSQRRIFQRLREGARSQSEIQQREYAARKASRQKSLDEHGLLPSQWKTIRALRNKIIKYGMDVEPYMDDDVLKEFAEIYGYTYLRTVLTDQLDSTEQYIAGDAGPGNRRWNARGNLEAQFGASSAVMYVRGTNPYYYYHGRRS